MEKVSHVKLKRETLDKLDAIIKKKEGEDQMERSYPTAIAEMVSNEYKRIGGDNG